MLEKYVLLDLENPNTRGNSICAIAVVLMENDKVVEKNILLSIRRIVLILLMRE